MISIQELYKSFGKNEVLKGINIDFNTSGITAVLGPNGSGKTTLIKSILGMVIPNSGEILVNNNPVKKQWKYRSEIDYLPQIARFPENLKVKDLINMIKDLRSQPCDSDSFIQTFGLQPFLNKRLGTLSGGTKQKVNLLLAFMYDNPILILDEPTNGLDPVALIHLKDLIRKERDKGKTILMTTHIMSLVEELADEIVFLLEGKIYFRGKVAELLESQNETNLERAIAKMLMGKKEIGEPTKTKNHAKNIQI